MVKRILIIGMTTLVLFLPAIADEIADIPLADGFISVGLRASAMGGAQIGLAHDFSACYYNPAGLAYIYKHEITGGLFIRGGSAETQVNSGSKKSAVFSTVKLSHFGYVLPLSSRRGGAAFAIGYSRFQSFDHSAKFDGESVYGVKLSAMESSDGGMGAIDIAAAVQTSPTASIGASFDILSGAENYTWDVMKYGFADTTIIDSILSDKFTNAHSGYTGKIGMLFTPSKYFSTGLTIKFPSFISTDREYIQETTVDYFDNTYTYESPYTEEYNISLTTPFQFGAGIAFKSPVINIATDAVYTDWRQTRYHSSYLIEDNIWIPDNFRSVLTLSAGAEFTSPFDVLPVKIRGGYRYDPLPYKNQEILKERQFYTGGLSILISKRWLVEGAVIMSNFKRNTSGDSGTITEEYEIDDIMFGLSYRF